MMAASPSLLKSEMSDVTLFHRGKVRDVYGIADKLLIVATDRISAFDCVSPSAIPGKGKILTDISLFWFDLLGDLTENHLVTADVNDYPQVLHQYRDQLEGRSMLVHKAEMIPVECIVRGYLTGSGWKDYQASGSLCGIQLPEGLQHSEKLETPLFTPSTKACEGHDENISLDQAAEIVGKDVLQQIQQKSLDIYQKAADYALSKGVILCDTKFEFGFFDGKIILIDEVLTPDSSRFWDKDHYTVGHDNESFDKQIVRDYLAGLDWDRKPPAPELPEEIILKTRDRYQEIVSRLKN